MQRIGEINHLGSEGLSKPSTHLEATESTSRRVRLQVALTKFSLLRGESMDAVRLESYSKALLEFPDDANTLAVLDKLVRSDREEFEPRIPEMGRMLQLVRNVRNTHRRVEREAREEAERKEYEAQCRREWADQGITQDEATQALHDKLNEMLGVRQQKPQRTQERETA